MANHRHFLSFFVQTFKLTLLLCCEIFDGEQTIVSENEIRIVTVH